MNKDFVNFFNDEIEKSIKLQHIKIHETVKSYLVDLLMESILLEKSILNIGQTITDLYFGAAESSSQFEKNLYLKSIGDLSLIKLGLFPESISREIVNSSFYKTMGMGAYASIYDDEPVYKIITLSYDDCVSILHGFKKASEIDNIANLYEFWKITESSFAFNRLVQLGFQFSFWKNLDKEE
jgi:hypothetical protein